MAGPAVVRGMRSHWGGFCGSSLLVSEGLCLHHRLPSLCWGLGGCACILALRAVMVGCARFFAGVRGAARVSLALFCPPACIEIFQHLLALCEADGACRRASNSMHLLALREAYSACARGSASAEPVRRAGEWHARRRSKLVSCASERLH